MSLKDNLRYKNLKVKEGTYIPDVGLDYPENEPLARMVPVRKVRDVVFDETYPYYDNSFKARLRRNIAYCCIVDTLLPLVVKLKFGLRIEGREVLKKYRKEFANGVISVSNHCFPLDAFCIQRALRHRLWIPMLSDLFTGHQWWYITGFGGIPLGDGSMSATKKFNEAFDKRHAEKGWIHVFPEARSWPFYKPLRPWMKGFFTMAYKWDCPVLPMAITYRERTGIHKYFGPKETPLITVRIGEPVFPDKTQPRKDEVVRMLLESHSRTWHLADITENSWPAIWEDADATPVNPAKAAPAPAATTAEATTK